MPLKSLASGDFKRGFATRSMVDLKVDALTCSFEGGENRKPGRILNVYVVPPTVGAGTVSEAGLAPEPSGRGHARFVLGGPDPRPPPRRPGAAPRPRSRAACR